jgi:hypothetical protein
MGGGNDSMPALNDATVIAAIIAAFTSLLLAIVNFVSTRRNQSQLEKLQEQQAEKDARRDYEYEARKRLYHQYEPLLFQLVEFSDSALWRIQGFAREAKNGNLDPKPGGWLSLNASQGYFMKSTIYRLLSPLVYVKLIQRSLTLIDLSVEPHLNNQYVLAKWLYATFTDGFKFAMINPRLEYDPNCDGWREKREERPEKYWRQGVHLGMLDNAIEALIVHETNGVFRCMSYGEFENACRDPETERKFSGFTDQFLDFHPRKRPILWRILITQVHIYEALVRSRDMKLSDPKKSIPPKLVKPIAKENLTHYDWRRSQDEAIDDEVFGQPFEVAQAYLQDVLGSMCDFTP